jgi:hypothetical protein
MKEAMDDMMVLQKHIASSKQIDNTERTQLAGPSDSLPVSGKENKDRVVLSLEQPNEYQDFKLPDVKLEGKQTYLEKSRPQTHK